MWKTKEIIRDNGTKARFMICQNSKPNESKWADHTPESGACDNWSEVSPKTTAVLCSACTQRSLKAVKF